MLKFLHKQRDKYKPHFEKGGKWERAYFVFEAFDTFLFIPEETTRSKGVQARDAVSLKRVLNTVIIAMIPCLLFGMYNVGHQHFLAIGQEVGVWDKFWIGIIKVLPIVVVSYASGLGVEFIFATIRRHPVSEGFLVTGMLIPLIMPPTIPLWQVALATVFGVLVGKEIFGGTGRNFLNPALTAVARIIY